MPISSIMNNKQTRRNFLKTGSLLTGSALISNHSVWAQTSSNEKLKVALIGGGGIAETAFGNCAKENVVAVADVDQKQGAAGFQKFPNAKQYKDFRKMLDAHEKELDAVIVSTPDHTHFVATYDAMQRGIAVQTQKPLTHNLWQARTLQAAAKKFNVQTVMGNQGHTMEGMKLIKDWVKADLAGEITEVHAWTNRTTTNISNSQNTSPKYIDPVPDHVDWDLWQGPTGPSKMINGICPKGWRWWWAYGLGGLGDIGCHTLEVPIFSMDLGYPKSVVCDKSINFSSQYGKKAKADAMTYIYTFERPGKPDLPVYWYEGGHLPEMPPSLVDEKGKLKEKVAGGGCYMKGKNNTIIAQGMRPTSPKMDQDWNEIRRNLPPKVTPRSIGGGPIGELFAAIRGEIDQPGSNFDHAVPLTESVILGTIAVRSGKTVEYLPETMTFKDASLNEYVQEPVRSGWEMGEGLIKVG